MDRAYVLTIRCKYIVLVQNPNKAFVVIVASDFMLDRIGAEINKWAHFKTFMPEAGCATHINHSIAAQQQFFCPRPRNPKPFLVAVASAIGPASFDAEICSEPLHVSDRVIRILYEALPHRIIRP